MKFKDYLNEKKEISKIDRYCFLGGTCNNSTWRDIIIPKLEIDYFNPVVEDWDDEAFKKELEEKEISNVMLFVLTPKMTGTYSIHEITFAVTTTDKEVVVCVIDESDTEKFTNGLLKSLNNQFKDLKSFNNFKLINADIFENRDKKSLLDILIKHLNRE